LTRIRGAFGSPVLALRARWRADAALPAEQPLLGGGSTVGGHRAGNRAGDSLAAVSAEIRVPFTSPLNFGRFGVKGFVDAGTIWSAGQRLADQPWDRGIGGGVFFGASVLTLDIDVAWPEHGNPRAHFSLGVTF
jgi:hemolysin activation/secretion protein